MFMGVSLGVVLRKVEGGWGVGCCGNVRNDDGESGMFVSTVVMLLMEILMMIMVVAIGDGGCDIDGR